MIIKEYSPKILQKKIFGNMLKIGNDTNFKSLISRLQDGLRLKFEKDLIKGKYDESLTSFKTLWLIVSSGKLMNDNIHFKDNNKIVIKRIVI